MQTGQSKNTFDGAEFAALLRGAGFDFFTGVPCSLIASVIRALEPVGYVPETREDAALGLAAGAAMAGRLPVVLMQNSGFGVSLNAIGSLQQIYRLPCLLVITWRGFQGKDAPEHLVMGEAMPAILEAMKIPWRSLTTAEPGSIRADIQWARDRLRKECQVAALIVPPGTLS